MNKHSVLSGDRKPNTPSIVLNAIPNPLKQMPIWLVWNWVLKNGKWTKPPAKGCTSNDASTWLTFEGACEYYYRDEVDGIGVALTNGLCGIDLDDCIDNGQLTKQARDIMAMLDCYYEVSPSGTGIKLLCFAQKPTGPNQNPAGTVEIYDSGRYFTITGHDAKGTIEHRQSEVETMYSKYIQLPNDPALKEMLTVRPHGTENDGSHRLVRVCIDAVEHNLSEDDAIRLIRIYETQFPFPIDWGDGEIIARIRQAEQRDDVVRGSAKPKILIADDRIPSAIEEAVASLGIAEIFQKENLLARIQNGKVVPVPREGMLELQTSAAQYQKRNAKGETINCLPTKDFRAAIHSRGHYPGIPEIDRVVTHSILLPNGDVVAEQGYNPHTKLFLASDTSYPAVMPFGDAVAKLKDIYCNFPWRSESDLSGILAITLTAVGRHLVDGSTPLFAVDGNRSGLGKGYATEVAINIATGQQAARYSGGTEDKTELRKYLTSAAMAGTSCILFDNVRGRFGGTVLEGVLTTGSITDRLLGVSKTVSLPLNVTWVLTANNVVYTDDMPRRVCPIFLDTDLERPDTRDDFKYPNLKAHVRQHRNELCMAAISILSGYIKAGCPNQSLSTFGGFEEWSDLVRSALVWAGMPDPLANRDVLFEAAVSASPVAKQLIDAWSFEEPITSKKLIEAVHADPIQHHRLHLILERKPQGRTDAEHLGKLLRSAKGLQYGNRKLVNDGKSHPKWYLEKC